MFPTSSRFSTIFSDSQIKPPHHILCVTISQQRYSCCVENITFGFSLAILATSQGVKEEFAAKTRRTPTAMSERRETSSRTPTSSSSAQGRWAEEQPGISTATAPIIIPGDFRRGSRVPSRSLAQCRATRNTTLRDTLKHMALPLRPLVRLTTGDIHPAFPDTMLGYWILTETQLEDLAHFYHQHTPCQWTEWYPCPITWSPELSFREKHRRFGKFIGLRGCFSPGTPKTVDDIINDAEPARIVEEDEL